MAAQQPADSADSADSAELVVAVPAGRLPATLCRLGLSGQPARALRLRLFDAPSGAGGLLLAAAGVTVRLTVRATVGRDRSRLTVVTVHRVRPSLLAAWLAGPPDRGGDRVRRVRECRGEESGLALELSAPSPSGPRDDDGRDDGWAHLMSRRQRELVRLSGGVDLGASRPVRSDPLTERLWPVHRHGIDLVVRRWTADTDRRREVVAFAPRFDALELSCRTSPSEAPFLRAALRAVARDLDLDADADAVPIDLRAAAVLLVTASG